jgi:uncharacterized protein YqhQ
VPRTDGRPPTDGGPRSDHYYGGQAVIEGVMMRGRDHWAVAVRRPDQRVHVECHEIRSIARRHALLRKPGFRGVFALGQALSIGARALAVSANQSVEDEQQLSSGQMAVSMVIAFTIFLAVFVVGPFLGFRLLRHRIDSSLARNALEGVARVALLLLYLAAIGRLKEIRRVFQYHGAEHKTIAAFEHGDSLEPAAVDRYSTLHVRCGTNFLLIVMALTILVYSAFGSRGLLAGILFRLVAIPVIAGFSFEMLRWGAKYQRSVVMRALMAPGLWLQKITTKPPDRGQIQVAIESFRALLRCESPSGQLGDSGPAAAGS